MSSELHLRLARRYVPYAGGLRGAQAISADIELVVALLRAPLGPSSLTQSSEQLTRRRASADGITLRTQSVCPDIVLVQ